MKVKDPVCGMTIDDKEAAGDYTYEGKTYYFCSPSCLVEFEKDPKVYIREPIEGTTWQEARASAGTGKKPDASLSCPTCGNELIPGASHVHAPQKTEWTCPMHPEIVRNEPGSFPICGMALEPRIVSAEQEENPELVSMTRRFWVSAVLTLPLILIMAAPGISRNGPVSHSSLRWLELILATPVVLWVRGLSPLRAAEHSKLRATVLYPA